MPAIVKDGDMIDQLPAHFRPVKLKNLRPNTIMTNKYVKAVVAERWPISNLSFLSLKLKLSDADGYRVEFLGMGPIAEEMDSISCGDTVICLKFVCVPTPKGFKDHFCIIADDRISEQSLLWFNKTSSGVPEQSVITRVKITKKQDKYVETRSVTSKQPYKHGDTMNSSSEKQDNRVEPNSTSNEQDKRVETRNNTSKEQDKLVNTRSVTSKEQDKPGDTRSVISKEQDKHCDTRSSSSKKQDKSLKTRSNTLKEKDKSLDKRSNTSKIQDNTSKERDDSINTNSNTSKVHDKTFVTHRNSVKGEDKSVEIGNTQVQHKTVETSQVQDKIIQTVESSVQVTSVGTISSHQSAIHQRAIHQNMPVNTVVRKKTPVYMYKALSEVEVDTVVDIYGVVKFCKPPVKTRGIDYHVLLGLTDASFDDPDDKLICSLFHRDMDQLPNAQEGDILRLHRVKIQLYSGKLQARNGPAFNWLLFRGSLDKKFSSSENYTFEQQDEEKFRQLTKWWGKVSQVPTSTLSQIEPRRYLNTVVQVVRVCELTPRKCVLLRAWDGTLFTGHPLKQAKEDEMNESLREDVLLVQASEGLAVDIYIFDNHTNTAAQVEVGSFIYFENLHAALVQDQLEITLHGGEKFGRKILVLPEDDERVIHLKAVLDPIVERTKCTLQTRKRSHSPEAASDDSSVTNKKPCHDQNSNNVSGSGSSHESSTCSFPNLVNAHEVCLIGGSSQEETLRLTANSNTQPCSTQGLGQHYSSEGCSVYESQDNFGLPLHASTQSNVHSNQTDSVPSSPSSFHTAPSPGERCDKVAAGGMSANTIHSKNKPVTLKIKQQNQNCQDEEPLCSLQLYNRCHQETSDSQQQLICPDTYTIHYVSSQETNPDTVDPTNQADQNSAKTDGQFRCMQNLATITVNHHHHVPLSTLAEVLQTKLPYKFRIQAKVKSISPIPRCYHDLLYLYCSKCQRKNFPKVSSFPNMFSVSSDDLSDAGDGFYPQKRLDDRLDLSPNEIACRYCLNQNHLTASLLLTFTFSDGKDTLSAHLLGEEALQFFHCDNVMKIKDPQKFQQVQTKLKLLCPDNAQLDDYPLIECCLLGYVKDGVAVYQIFDTILISLSMDGLIQSFEEVHTNPCCL